MPLASTSRGYCLAALIVSLTPFGPGWRWIRPHGSAVVAPAAAVSTHRRDASIRDTQMARAVGNAAREIGLPKWDILWARKGEKAIGFELSGDIPFPDAVKPDHSNK